MTDATEIVVKLPPPDELTTAQKFFLVTHPSILALYQEYWKRIEATAANSTDPTVEEQEAVLDSITSDMEAAREERAKKLKEFWGKFGKWVWIIVIVIIIIVIIITVAPLAMGAQIMKQKNQS